MKHLLLFLFIIYYSGATAQDTLYVNKTTGEFTKYSGSYSKKTDNYESGHYSLSTEGPIKIDVLPTEFSINPNEDKTWNGTIIPDTAKAPAVGDFAMAALKFEGSHTYSRPFDAVGRPGEIIESSYSCGNGCTVHPGGGMHQIVRENGSGQLAFVVFTTGVTIEGPDCAYKGSKLKLTAKGAPEGGSYEWKNLSPGHLEVKGNGAEAIITYKALKGVGKGVVQVEYKVGDAIHTDKRQVTFFTMTPELANDTICDGEGVAVTLITDPKITPVTKVKECLANLKIHSKPIVEGGKNATAMNIVTHTDIKFSEPDDKLASTADIAYWFISSEKITECIYNGVYEIWAEADNNFADEPVKTGTTNLAVNVGFNKCVNGSAHIEPDIPRLDTPVYKIISKDFNKLAIQISVPTGPYPIFSIELKKHPKAIRRNGKSVLGYRLLGKYDAGAFKVSRTKQDNITNPKSQFYSRVQFEENYHTKQFAGETDIFLLKELLSAEKIVEKSNAKIKQSDVFSQEEITDELIKAYGAACWGILVQEVGVVVEECKKVGSKWNRFVRCELEREAKTELVLQFGHIFTLDMPCAYTTCKFTDEK